MFPPPDCSHRPGCTPRRGVHGSALDQGRPFGPPHQTVGPSTAATVPLRRRCQRPALMSGNGCTQICQASELGESPSLFEEYASHRPSGESDISPAPQSSDTTSGTSLMGSSISSTNSGLDGGQLRDTQDFNRVCASADIHSPDAEPSLQENGDTIRPQDGRRRRR